MFLNHLLYLYNDETCRLVVQISSNLTIYCHSASLVLYRQMKHCSNQLAEGFKIQLAEGFEIQLAEGFKIQLS